LLWHKYSNIFDPYNKQKNHVKDPITNQISHHPKFSLIMKYTLLLTLTLFLIPMIHYSQPPDIMEEIHSTETDRIIGEDCISLHYDLGKKLIVLDCPDYDYYEYDGDHSFSIFMEAGCLARDCHIDVYISFNGQTLYEKRLTQNDYKLTAPIDYHALQELIGEAYQEEALILEIRYIKSCFVESGEGKPSFISYDPVIEEIPIQLRHEYETYTVDLITEREAFDICEELYANNQINIDEVSSCCGKKISVDAKVSILEGHKISIDGRIAVGFKTGINDLDGSVSFSYAESSFRVAQKLMSYGEHFSFASDNSSCIFLGYKFYYRKHEVLEKLVSCIGGESTLNMLETYYEIYKIEPTVCEYTFNCNGQNPYIDIQIQPDDFARALNCRANVLLTLIDPEPDMPYEYLWTGPDGSTYDSKDLANVAFGPYQLTIRDACCNEFNYQVNVCIDMYYGPWYFENDLYCREITCHCEDNPAFTQAEDSYTMCVEPDRVDGWWSFNEQLKKCTRHAYYTDQNGYEWDLTAEVGKADLYSEHPMVTKNPIIKEYFDHFYSECIREYHCNEDELSIHYETTDPVFGDWDYDEIGATCFREVLCHGYPAVDENGFITLDEADYTSYDWTIDSNDGLKCIGQLYCEETQTEAGIYMEPDVMWEIDEITGDCVTHYIACNRELLDNIAETPAIIHNWEWDGNDLCTREVYCETADEYLTEYSGALFTYDPSNSANCDTESNEHTYQVNCGEELIGWFCIEQEPPALKGETAVYPKMRLLSTDQLKSIELPGNASTLKSQTASTKFEVVISTVDGLAQHHIYANGMEEVYSVINHFKSTGTIKNQLYFISVFSGDTLLFSNKYIDFK
jgi:hypothetical protein